MSLTSQVGAGQVGAAQVGNIPAVAGGPSFAIVPSSGHQVGVQHIVATITGAVASASNTFSVVSGPATAGAVSNYVKDSATQVQFDITTTAVSGTPIVISDSNTASTRNFSNAAIAPGPPTSLVATGGNAQASVTFSAPSDNGGSTVAGYTLIPSVGSGVDSNAGSTALTHVMTGLTNGVSVSFTGTATNSAGTSVASTASNSVTPAAPGGTVSILTRAPYLTTDTIGVKIIQVQDIASTFLANVGGAVTTGFVDIGDIANGWWNWLSVTPNNAFSVFAGIAIFSNINGSGKAAIALNSPPTSTPTILVKCEVAPLLSGDTVVTPVNNTVTMTIASPGVLTWAAHPLVNGNIVQLGTTGALPTGLVAGTPYYVVNKATNTFQLSATLGGSAINTSGSQSGTHTAYAGPGYRLHNGTSYAARVNTGILAISGVTNGYAAKITVTPDANYGAQYGIKWDGG